MASMSAAVAAQLHRTHHRSSHHRTIGLLPSGQTAAARPQGCPLPTPSIITMLHRRDGRHSLPSGGGPGPDAELTVSAATPPSQSSHLPLLSQDNYYPAVATITASAITGVEAGFIHILLPPPVPMTRLVPACSNISSGSSGAFAPPLPSSTA